MTCSKNQNPTSKFSNRCKQTTHSNTNAHSQKIHKPIQLPKIVQNHQKCTVAMSEWSACSEGGISDEGSERESFDERAGLGLK